MIMAQICKTIIEQRCMCVRKSFWKLQQIYQDRGPPDWLPEIDTKT